MRPKHGVKPKRKLIGGRLVYPAVMPRTVKPELPVAYPAPIHSTDLATQVQRDAGRGISNMSAQDRVNLAFKNMRVSQSGRGVRML